MRSIPPAASGRPEKRCTAQTAVSPSGLVMAWTSTADPGTGRTWRLGLPPGRLRPGAEIEAREIVAEYLTLNVRCKGQAQVGEVRLWLAPLRRSMRGWLA
jgi:hypothetical protein